MKIVLTDKTEIADDTVLFGFESADGSVSYVPGQFAALKLDLKYPDEKGPERYFSIVNPPGNTSDLRGGRIEIATRISGTGFKQTLAAMQAGDAAEVIRIGGRFVLPQDPAKEIVMVAGGVGITPFHCMLADLASTGETRGVTLLYSNKNKANTAFYDALLQMEDAGVIRKVFFVMTRDDTWPGPKGRMNAEFIADNVPGYQETHFMVAGPPNFVGGISQALETLRVTDVRVEKFFGT